jgi:hypothetical protein
LIEFVGFDHEMLAGAILVAADDGGVVHRSVHGAVLGVAQALAAVGVEEVGRWHVAGADGGIGIEWNADQAGILGIGPDVRDVA